MENNQDASPVIPPKKIERITLDFPEAMRQVIAGKRVTKEEWHDEKQYVELAQGFLIIHTDEDHKWMINDGDLLGTDYYVLQ